MREAKSFAGGCHCGQVRFEVELDPSRPVISCNCSMCRRMGSLLAFVSPDSFTLRSGQDALTDYQFNQKVIHHLFCSRCGIRSFARGVAPDGTERVAVNVRCIEDLELAKLQIQTFDGRSL
jgi:hypothetical protein